MPRNTAGTNAREMLYPTVAQLDANPLYNHLIDIADQISRSKEIVINYGAELPTPNLISAALGTTTDDSASYRPARSAGDTFYVTSESSTTKEGLYVYTGSEWIPATKFYNFTPGAGTRTLGPLEYPPSTLSGFDAYNSTGTIEDPDMPGPWHVGLTISGQSYGAGSVNSAQIAISWNHEEGKPGDAVSYRVNDDTGNISKWGPWTTLLDENSTRGKFVIRSGDTMTGRLVFSPGISGGLAFPNDAFGGTGDSASITLESASGELDDENTRLRFRVANNAGGDKAEFIVPDNRSLLVNNNVVWNAGNDGHTSGLDSDTLDGQHASYFTDLIVNGDYLNNYPKAGFGKYDNEVPVYADFKFSLGAWGAPAFTFVDKEAQTVTYFAGTTPTGLTRQFRARRYSNSDNFIFDNEPLSATFLVPKVEYINAIFNVGTNFIFFSAFNTQSQTNRYVVARTGGSSRWQDWTLACDITATFSNRPIAWNISLVTIGAHERLLIVGYANGQMTLTTNSFTSDGVLTIIASQVLYNRDTDVSLIDTEDVYLPLTQFDFGYNAYSLPSGFTWNPFNGDFHIKFGGYRYMRLVAGGTRGRGFALDVSWNIPPSWIVSGTGTLTNLIPIKTGTIRYYAIENSTWNTVDGGMSTNLRADGASFSLVTDEYTGNLYHTTKGTFSSSQAAAYHIFPIGKTHKTLVAQETSYGYEFTIPDGSPWSKALVANITNIIGTNISFVGLSSKYGSRAITTDFSPNSFGTSSNQNDTLKLDSSNAVISPSYPAGMTNTGAGTFGTTVLNNTGIYYWGYPGNNLFTGTAVGVNRNWTDSGMAIPQIPSTIGSVTELTFFGNFSWNGSTSSPIYYLVVKSRTSIHVAKYSSGTWTISPALSQSSINSGNANRQDATYQVSPTSTTLLTESGRLLIGFSVPFVGGAGFYFTIYNVNSDSEETAHGITIWQPSAKYGSLKGSSGYSGYGFGFSNEFGYFAAVGSTVFDNIAIISSRDIRGTGTTLTENEFFDFSAAGNAARNVIFITVENVAGLVAYVTEYPIFIGGYYTKVPNTTVSLEANTVNYVYAIKEPGDRTTVSVTSSTTKIPNSFSRLILAEITTNSDNITDSYIYAHDGMGLADQTGQVGKVLKTDGKRTYWDLDLPSQLGKAGNYLTTNGADARWSVLDLTNFATHQEVIDATTYNVNYPAYFRIFDTPGTYLIDYLNGPAGNVSFVAVGGGGGGSGAGYKDNEWSGGGGGGGGLSTGTFIPVIPAGTDPTRTKIKIVVGAGGAGGGARNADRTANPGFDGGVSTISLIDTSTGLETVIVTSGGGKGAISGFDGGGNGDGGKGGAGGTGSLSTGSSGSDGTGRFANGWEAIAGGFGGFAQFSLSSGGTAGGGAAPRDGGAGTIGGGGGGGGINNGPGAGGRGGNGYIVLERVASSDTITFNDVAQAFTGSTNSSYVNKSGDTMTGQLNTLAPVDAANAANKKYVDNATAAIQATIAGIQATVSGVVLADFPHVFSGNGYQKIPGGLIIQWGSISGSGNWNFPISFPNAGLSIAVSSINGAAIVSNSAFTGATETFFDDIGNVVGYGTGSYIAIGY